MKIINLKKFEENEFLNEIKNINFSNSKVLLNNQLCKNIKIFFNFLKNNNIKEFILVNDKNIDLLSIRILKNFFEENIINFYNKINIIFIKFKQEEVLEFLEFKWLLYYYGENNLKIKHDRKNLKNTNKIIKNNNKIISKYKELKIIIKNFKKNPYSNISFPNEEKVERIVYYHYIYSKNTKDNFLNLLKKLNILVPEIIEIVKKNNIYKKISHYALGIIFKNKKIFRLTLYSFFLNPLDSKKNINFINKNHNLDLKYNLDIITLYGLDFYENYNEIKIYVTTKKIDLNLLNLSKISKILNKIIFEQVFKFRNKKLIDSKLTFNLKKLNLNEIKSFKKNKLYKKNFKFLSLYIKNKKINKKIFYDI